MCFLNHLIKCGNLKKYQGRSIQKLHHDLHLLGVNTHGNPMKICVKSLLELTVIKLEDVHLIAHWVKEGGFNLHMCNSLLLLCDVSVLSKVFFICLTGWSYNIILYSFIL
jgi:hypothetical protein